MVQWLLQAGAGSLADTDNRGFTPFILAAANDRLAVLRWLADTRPSDDMIRQVLVRLRERKEKGRREKGEKKERGRWSHEGK